MSGGELQPASGAAEVSPTVVDEAVSAAEGTRATARWIASSLAAIPSLAVLASIVRAPGNNGFDPTMLALGIALAAVGAVTGVLLFARVIAPVPLEDADVRKVDLNRIPGQPYRSFAELESGLEELRQATAERKSATVHQLARAKRAEVHAQRDQLAAKEAEAAAASGDPALKERAEKARDTADRARGTATAEAAAAAADKVELSVWTDQLSQRDSIRQEAYRLRAADIVGKRYLIARIGAVLSVTLITIGVVLLGLAPNTPQPATARTTLAALPRLATLTLSKAGQRALHCPLRSVQALETGGSAATPTVITLPVRGCPSRTVVFTTRSAAPLGTISVARPIGGR